MKKLYFLIIFSIFLIPKTNAQEIRFSVTGGYVFDDSFDSYFDFDEFYEGTIEGGFVWSVGGEYMIWPQYGIELSYTRQDTKAPTYYFVRGDLRESFSDFDLGINYIMLGGNRYFSSAGSPVEGFLGVQGGMVIASIDNPDNGRSDSTTKFAWGVKLGGVYWATDFIGVKVQTRLMSAVQAMGGGFYFGTGGPGAGVSSYSTIYQFGFDGGIVLKI